MNIQNFKGCKDRTIEFGEKTRISGANATGKTTIFDGKKCLLMCWGAIRATSLTARLTVCVNGKEYCSGLTSSASYVPVFDSCIMTLPEGQSTIELKLSAQENTVTAYIGRYHKLGFIVAEL